VIVLHFSRGGWTRVASQAKLDFGNASSKPSLRGEARTMNVVPFGGING
jgi:hypothetical protein